MTTEATRVGIISCSGEELPEGTTSRVACRRVLEDLQAGQERHHMPAPLYRRWGGGTEVRGPIPDHYR